MKVTSSKWEGNEQVVSKLDVDTVRFTLTNGTILEVGPARGDDDGALEVRKIEGRPISLNLEPRSSNVVEVR